MKIMIHSNAPWVPSGYGQQVKLLAPRLVKLGHEVAISAFHGLSGSPILWQDMPIYPASDVPFGADVIIPHARVFAADLIITLMDYWQLLPVAKHLGQEGIPILAWIPNDCHPLSSGDDMTLRASRARPVAMSNFGLATMQEAGYIDTAYAPHAVDTVIFSPPTAEGRGLAREHMNIPDDHFVVGICAANRDAVRKGFPEQFHGFSQFHHLHPKSTLVVHTVPDSRRGLNLEALAKDMNIDDAIRFSDSYPQVAGLIGEADIADWYGSLDVLLACSYAEAFGIPIIEAQACGIPVIATNGSAMKELTRPMWRVHADPFFNSVHRAWWDRPRAEGQGSIAELLGRLYRRTRDPEGRAAEASYAREFALGYDVEHVVERYWRPLLAAVEPADDDPAGWRG